jgi:hypothetical protein
LVAGIGEKEEEDEGLEGRDGVGWWFPAFLMLEGDILGFPHEPRRRDHFAVRLEFGLLFLIPLSLSFTFSMVGSAFLDFIALALARRRGHLHDGNDGSDISTIPLIPHAHTLIYSS